MRVGAAAPRFFAAFEPLSTHENSDSSALFPYRDERPDGTRTDEIMQFSPNSLPSLRATPSLRSISAAVALTAAGLAVLPVAAQAQAPVALGIWYDDTGKGAVEIAPCGSKLCGRIVWLKEPISEKTGKPLVDAYNPEEGKRTRPICGLQILGELARQSDGTWDDGWVYDPKVGKSFDAAIAVQGATLKLTGYKGVKLFSKSFTWTKAPVDLPRCDGTPPAKAETKAAPAKPTAADAR